MKVKMVPHLDNMGGESGVKRVVEAYFKYLPSYGIELVNSDTYDIVAAHAGILGGGCDVAHLHGIYFTADYRASNDEFNTNRNVVQSAVSAKIVTVPSSWVAKTFQRDMRIDPIVLPHGIETDLWEHKEFNEGYILWNKNRRSDVCDPNPVGELATLAPDSVFISTFPPDKLPSNVKGIGLLPHEHMKRVIQAAAVYLSTTKETFGIGTLEALAAGTPVLGWAHGGNLDLVQHGVTGYLARPGNYEDLREGLDFCLKYRKELSYNARVSARRWTWDNVIKQLAEIYEQAAKPEAPTASIIIPCYEKTYQEVERAVKSAISQTYTQLEHVVVVDDSSSNGEQLRGLTLLDSRVKFVKTPRNSGVANARNYGIAQVTSKYVCCLDGDDAMAPTFLSTCIAHLEATPSDGIAYTKLTVVNADESTLVPGWPNAFDYEKQMSKANQVPTCCVFRRKLWSRLGGYRQRYAPFRAGEEDAELWLRIGSIGYGAKLVSEEPLFLYHTASNTVGGNPNHQQTDWVSWHPWVKDKRYPFASIAKPSNERSHPVRQYDEPLISVIIPVAPWHTGYMVDALDSLEAQTFRSWEAICVFDGLPQDLKLYARLKKAYPYITIIENFGASKGAGWARDAGIKVSKGKFIVFLDADDYLAPDYMELTTRAYSKTPGIIYTDYVDRALWSKEEFDKLPDNRKVSYNPVTNEAVIRRFAKKYDWNEAIKQPEYNPSDPDAPFYVWCITTVLLPKVWYDEVGGLDQTLDTWEDVDLHWRLARYGKPFFRVPEPLVTYRFSSGSRREHGMVRDEGTAKKFKERLDYLTTKYKEIPAMACGGCGNGEAAANVLASQMFSQQFSAAKATAGGFSTMSDSDFKVCLYDSLNMGDHPVVGRSTGKNYGYHAGGEEFLVHVSDIAAQPDLFKPKPEVVVTNVQEPEIVAPPVPEIVTDFEGISGISPTTQEKLVAANIYNAADIVSAGKTGLEAAGVLPKTATLIYNSAKKKF